VGVRAREPPSSSLARAGGRAVLSDRSRKKQASSAGNAPFAQMLHRAAELAPDRHVQVAGGPPWRSRLEVREHPCGACVVLCGQQLQNVEVGGGLRDIALGVNAASGRHDPLLDLWHATSLLALMNWEMRKDTRRGRAGMRARPPQCRRVVQCSRSTWCQQKTKTRFGRRMGF
jgi:hypothetical protein